jgi:hypothetical protein
MRVFWDTNLFVYLCRCRDRQDIVQSPNPTGRDSKCSLERITDHAIFFDGHEREDY